MADRIIHKRSLTEGSVPTTSSLEIGELAININDGKAFLRRSGSGNNDVVPLVTANTITTGSITATSFTGSLQGTASWAESASQAISSSYSSTASYVNPLIQNVIITGSLLLTQSYISTVDYIDFNTSSITTNTTGRVNWIDGDGTLELGLKGGVVKSLLGQGLVTRVVNKTNPLIDLTGSNYQVVVVAGAQGQRLAVKLAQADNDINSAGTLGLVAENINRNEEGFIVTVGLLKNIDTRGVLQGETWNDGDILYLSPTIAGQITNIKPQAPQHTVIIGYVEYAHQNNGKIYVKIDNGYELDELHNVRITTSSLTTGQLLSYSSSIWINTNQLTGSYGLTGSLSFTGGGVTGSLFGTASWADSASQALTASYITGSIFTSTNPALSASYALTASYAANAGGTFNSTSSIIGNGLSSSFDINHGFNTRNLHITVYESGSNGETVYPDIRRINANTASIIFANPPASNEYIVYISQ
jgi:hypothetical protein